ncbi:MAG: DUF294 nucleotidyltransferase-like domain-containing protein [Pseudomonadota bacterium]
MDLAVSDVAHFLANVHPYDSLSAEELQAVADKFEAFDYKRGDEIYKVGQVLPGLFLVHDGAVEVRDARGGQVSFLMARNSFGERGLTKEGVAVTTAVAVEDTRVLVLPASTFRTLIDSHESFARFFDRTHAEDKRTPNLATMPVSNLLAGPPITCSSDTTILEAARMMRARDISSLAIVDMGLLAGIVTTSDLSNRALAEGLDTSLPVSRIMTPDPVTLRSNSLGTDVLHIMHERRIGHLPIVDGDELKGMVTQTDLTRLQAVTSAQFVSDIARARSAAGLAKVTEQIPQLLVQLVGAGNRHEVVTRLITDIADAVTRRLLKLAEAKLGPPPVPYLWLACGSQGRREQTGVSDQDNCLFLDERVTKDDFAYFDQLAKFVTDGLDTCGYVYCPGDMMATNPRWRQPISVWRGYFDDWIATPNPEAQMLASVMFDLRPIGGRESLFTELQQETLAKASKNSIFVSHMIANSLKHAPPLSLLRGFATIKSGEHKNHLDLKHSGVVPVVDLGRVYALQGQLTAVNTRARLEEAAQKGVLSKTGASDLLDAYDLIAQTRLEHQAKQVRQGGKPNNFMAPTELSDFERSHLRDAFVVIRTLQSAIGHGRGMLG